jgi:hypothetical protein
MAINQLQLPSSQAFSGGLDFSPLANLGEVYKKAQNEQRLSDLGKQLAAGSIDYKTAAGQVADMGDITHSLQFLALSEQQKKQEADEIAASKANFNNSLASCMAQARPRHLPFEARSCHCGNSLARLSRLRHRPALRSRRLDELSAMPKALRRACMTRPLHLAFVLLCRSLMRLRQRLLLGLRLCRSLTTSQVRSIFQSC